MFNLKGAIRYFTDKEPSQEQLKALDNFAREFGCRSNDLLFMAIAVWDTLHREIADSVKQLPKEADAVITRMRETGDWEVSNCEKKMAASSELLQLKIIRDVVPEISKKVIEAASAKIAEANAELTRENRHYKIVLVGIIAVVIAVACYGFGFLDGGKLSSIPNFQLAGANVAAHGLFDAVRNNNNPWHLKRLISAGANVNIVDRNGDTPLLLAVKRNSDIDIITALIEGGADVNAQYGNEGYTPLIVAVRRETPSIDVITALVKAGADASAKDRISGETVLDYAKKKGMDAAILKFLGDEGKKNNVRKK